MRGISALSASRSISSARRPRFCSVAESMRDKGRSLKKVGSQYSGRPTGAEGSSGGFDARVGGEGALARSAKIDDRPRVIAPEFDSGPGKLFGRCQPWHACGARIALGQFRQPPARSEEHTSELQSLMRTSY